MVALIGDNCSKNWSLSKRIEVPRTGCVSHRFQLAVREILQEDKAVIIQVKQLMTKLKTPFISARL